MIDKGLFSTFSSSAWFFAMGASEFVSAPLAEYDAVDESRLIELRVFDDNHEIKWVRGSLADEFAYRDSASISSEWQQCLEYFLDIDKTKSEQGFVWATGGGKYRLPDFDPEKIKVEHYYNADDKGFYKPFDFRVVKFV
ncbi:MAG: hypothetical protein LBI54_10760 [Lachnospiraceae bacterium]|jgi:hypothetical protein|nr:hypothetical protein [Lachnospiraceae bacterium]